MSCDYEYLTDGGKHDPRVDMTTYDFLASHSWQYFDTLVMLIDHHNMKEEVNAAGTFLVVTDYSFRKYMRFNWTLDSLKKYVTADTLRNYLFDDPILMEDLSKIGDNEITSESGLEYNFELIEQVDNAYTEWTNEPVYRLSINRMINEIEVKNYVQSSNIQTNTGVVHAMANTHIFNYGF
ncbi:hypothetical protein DQQ10_07070 [Pseudochryseolinea flava]|uniref:FAS1 domain-containing protein n=2 Tax=Pseudochryseolinea flava TaxID=2059302 RepID=A0A364Y5Z1_9BACT|nr:hypothetical protein DQQ10_07070 [Pseudochryseolinea flava]